MSTVDDTLPYMQAWLDSRPIANTARTEFNTAKTAVENARAAIQARVQAGDNAQQMKSLVDTYATTRTTYIAKDAALQTATTNTANAAQAFEASVELLARGQTVPPYTPGAVVASTGDTGGSTGGGSGGSGTGTGTGIETLVPPEPEI